MRAGNRAFVVDACATIIAARQDRGGVAARKHEP